MSMVIMVQLFTSVSYMKAPEAGKVVNVVGNPKSDMV